MRGLLEREDEVARIAALVDSVRDRGILSIEGRAGIGKTELLEAARQAARDRGLALASARGVELEAASRARRCWWSPRCASERRP